MNRREMLISSGVTMLSLPAFAAAQGRVGRPTRKPLIGVDYYPEQTDRRLWAEDVRRIADLGITFVRMAEFAWSDMEPNEGGFVFDWLEQVVEMFRAVGIESVLGTPSAAPPPWLTARYPQVMMVNRAGVRLTPGSRRSTCPTLPLYRDLSKKIAGAMVERFAGRAGVIGWQIDNEPSLGGGRRCYCDACRSGFQSWLRSRYQNLGALNQAWGTSFWSARYTSFEQVPVPLASMGDPNPGLALDYNRYQSEAWVAFVEAQVDVVRAGARGAWITSNNVSIPGADVIDPHELTKKLDFFSVDTYPSFFTGYFSAAGLGVDRNPSLEHQVAIPAFIADAARSAKLGSPFMVMEGQVGRTGFSQVPMSPQPEAGQVRLWTLQNVAHGARGFSYFRWDTPRSGQEQLWQGLVNYDRTPGAAYEEIRRTISDARALDAILEAPLLTDIAILNTMDTSWSYDTQPITASPGHRAVLFDWYVAATQRESAVDVIASASLLRGHRVVLAPSMLVASEREAESIRRFVEEGGLFISGHRLGWMDGAAQITDRGFPGHLRDLFGLEVADYTPLRPSATASLGATGEYAGLNGLAASAWVERLVPRGATPLATWTDGPYAGQAAITSRRAGRGRVVYIGGIFGREPLRAILERVIYDQGQQSIVCPPGVEMTRRGTRQSHAIFLLNHNGSSAAVELGSTRYRDRLSREVVTGTLGLRPYDVRVLERV